jgi:hypothetical protein
MKAGSEPDIPRRVEGYFDSWKFFRIRDRESGIRDHGSVREAAKR